MQRLIEDAALVLLAAPVEDAVPPEVLRAYVGAEVLPLRILRIVGRLDRIRTDVAERARHADAVRAHQLAVEVVRRIVVEALRVPPLARLLVEVRIGKESKADNAGGLAVVRADRNRLSPRADLHARVLGGIGKRIGRAARIAGVEPQPETIRIGSGRFRETRFVHQTEIAPSVVASVTGAVRRVRLIGMRRDRLEEIEGSDAVDRQPVPQRVVAAGPDEPRVEPFDLLRRERRSQALDSFVVLVVDLYYHTHTT